MTVRSTDAPDPGGHRPVPGGPLARRFVLLAGAAAFTLGTAAALAARTAWPTAGPLLALAAFAFAAVLAAALALVGLAVIDPVRWRA